MCEGALAGTVNLEVSTAARSAMLGYAIARPFWGRGIAVEAARAMIGWGQQVFDLTRVWASTDVAHVRSQRVMQKLGMTLEHVQVGHHRGRDDAWVDEVVFGMSLSG